MIPRILAPFLVVLILIQTCAVLAAPNEVTIVVTPPVQTGENQTTLRGTDTPVVTPSSEVNASGIPWNEIWFGVVFCILVIVVFLIGRDMLDYNPPPPEG